MVLRRTASEWTAPTAIETGTAGFGVGIDIAIDPTTHQPAIVHGPDNAKRYVAFDGAAWKPAEETGGNYATVTFDASGVPHVGYTKSGQSWIAVRQADGTWVHELVDLTGGGRNVIGVDDGGVVHLLYDSQPDGMDLAKKATP